MKTVLVHDWLTTMGGAERVLETILDLFPSPIMTLVCNQHGLSPRLRKASIETSFLQCMPLATTHYQYYLPLFPRAIDRFDVSAYDVVISSSHAVAKGVRTSSHQLHVCYCHTPMRYIWDLEQEYLSSMGLLSSAVARRVFKMLRTWDRATADRVNVWIANSRYIADRIFRIYGKRATVIYPPVATDRFQPRQKKDNFYLTVSRLVPYKRVNLLVEAFRHMPHRHLKIVGSGQQFNLIKKKASSNVELLGAQPDDVVQELMASAKGFVFAAEEDFGIAPVEAQAAGTPVVAYGRGGVVETVVPGITGVLFDEPTVGGVIASIDQCEMISWDSGRIAAHSHQFGIEKFKQQFAQSVQGAWEEYCESRRACWR